MADIVLATFNSRYSNPSLGLRYLMANMAELKCRTRLLEFGLGHASAEALERVMAEDPRIVGVSVSIWNVRQSEELVAAVKCLAPHTRIVLGGPEVSHETEEQGITALADYVITGEGDLSFPDLCRKVLAGTPPQPGVIHGEAPHLNEVVLPYRMYSEEDLTHRAVYIEASRGCPFHCEFCLSGGDGGVRHFECEKILEALSDLAARGAKHFKFVDRTFNLPSDASIAILDFFLRHAPAGVYGHFEIVPDILTESLKEKLSLFPPGTIQLEAGVQSLNAEVCERISRKQDCGRAIENLRFLRQKTNVHVHADLVFGLPGEDFESMARGFDTLHALGLQEVQVGILKRLRGARIVRHAEPYGLLFSPHPPYEILKSNLVRFEDFQALKRFAHLWDVLSNSGNFKRTLPLLFQGQASVFQSFFDLTAWAYQKLERVHAISLQNWCELLFEYLSTHAASACEESASALYRDYSSEGRRDFPRTLARYVPEDLVKETKELLLHADREGIPPPRQRKHL